MDGQENAASGLKLPEKFLNSQTNCMSKGKKTKQ
jgi:hypothetical protein